MDVTWGVVVEFVSSVFAFGIEVKLILVSPIKDLTGARFILGHPWNDHGRPIMISLGDMYLQAKGRTNSIQSSSPKNYNKNDLLQKQCPLQLK